MKTVGIAVVRNEADLIETFVRHHMQFCDAMLITDHLSSDGCAEILDALAAEDSRVHVLRDRRNGFFQQEIMTRLMREAARELHADWIFCLDGDEFVATKDENGVRAVLRGLPSERVIRLPWRTYVPRPEDEFHHGNVLARIQYRRAEEKEVIRKVVIPGALAQRDDVVVGAGNHHLLDRSNRFRPKVRALKTSRLFLAHFPVRSSSQMTKRSVIGCLSRIALGEQERVVGFHVVGLYERFKAGAHLSPSELTDLAHAFPCGDSTCPPAGRLVFDPVPHDPAKLEPRFGNRVEEKPFTAVVNLAEAMAREIAMRRTEQLAERVNHEDGSWLRRLARIRGRAGESGILRQK